MAEERQQARRRSAASARHRADELLQQRTALAALSSRARQGARAAEHHAIRLHEIQRELQRIYEIELEHDVDDFLITDRSIGETVHPRSAREKLILVQEGDALDLGLYLDEDILHTLREQDPRARLDRSNLQDFLTALEGVSHFLYLAWNAGHDKPVSLLELELQAEVDKYITSAVWLSAQRAAFDPARLRRSLFARPSYLHDLDDSEHRRYRRANDFAHSFCLRLERSYRHDFGGGRMFNELRRFYRLPQAGKLKHITAA